MKRKAKVLSTSNDGEASPAHQQQPDSGPSGGKATPTKTTPPSDEEEVPPPPPPPIETSVEEARVIFNGVEEPKCE